MSHVVGTAMRRYPCGSARSCCRTGVSPADRVVAGMQATLRLESTEPNPVAIEVRLKLLVD
jgi:hypothetical protein